MLEKLLQAVSLYDDETEEKFHLSPKEKFLYTIISIGFLLILLYCIWALDTDDVAQSQNIAGAYSWESQGNFARVKNPDGWAIIDRQNNILLDKCSTINTLPEIATKGTAIRDGKALIFALSYAQDSNRVYILAEIPDVSEISDIYYNEFAIIKGLDGYGAVSLDGSIIIPPKYTQVDWEAIPFDDDTYGSKIIFKCQTEKGSCETVNWDPREE